MFQKNLIFSFGGTKPRGRVREARAGFQAPRREMKAVAAARHLSEGGIHLWGGKRLSHPPQQNLLAAVLSAQEQTPGGAG